MNATKLQYMIKVSKCRAAKHSLYCEYNQESSVMKNARGKVAVKLIPLRKVLETILAFPGQKFMMG